VSPSDGYEGVEREFVSRRLTDQDVEALLAGDIGQERPDLAALDEALTDWRGSVLQPVAIDPAIAARHIAAAAAMAGSAAAGDIAPEAAGPARSRVRTIVKGALSGLTAKILLGTAVALAATGGAAAAGILPAPVQDAVSRGAGAIGIDLPTSHHEDESTTTTIPDPDAGTTIPGVLGVTTTTTTPSPDDGDTTFGPITGAFSWTGTACDGSEATIAYSVGPDGVLHLDDTNGTVKETRPDRIEVEFEGGYVVRVETVDHDDAWTVIVSEHGSCSGDDQDVTTTTQASDDNGQSDDGSDDGTVDGSDDGQSGDQEVDDTQASDGERDGDSDQGTSSGPGSGDEEDGELP